MDKKTMIGALAGVAGMFGLAAGAGAEEILGQMQVHDTGMGAGLYLFKTDRDGRTLDVHRGRYDHVVGVRCEWEGQASLNENNEVSIEVDNYECSQEKLPGSWAELPEHLTNGIFGEKIYEITFDSEADTVIETSSTPRTSLGVTSAYQREWNLSTGQVCLSAKEGQFVSDGQDGETYNQYMNQDYGCYDFPDNERAREMRQIGANFGLK